jgi:hypothetical protein
MPQIKCKWDGWLSGLATSNSVFERRVHMRHGVLHSEEDVSISLSQQKRENLKAVTFLNCNCISPESPGGRLIEETEFPFLLERAYGSCFAEERVEGSGADDGRVELRIRRTAS